ncbi:MAG TPA: M48 family metallopeptidase [Burkholderiaceae bacterium]|nr:M48 family metallopeptidase [Burkholderiaceae bacterium]
MPPSLSFSLVFAAAVIVTVALRVWLATRQIRHVARHRNEVPAAFAARVPLAAHQRAADYTIARTRLGLLELALSTAVLFAFTLLGGMQWLHDGLVMLLPEGVWLRPLAFVVGVALIGGLVDLPLSWYRQFRLEEGFGFNRMTVRLWVADMFKGFAVSLALGLPLLAGVLALMRSAGSGWWLWAWLLWVAFNLAVLVLYPTVIAPLFNKFEPMPDGPVRSRVEALLARCGFTSRGLFVMDGSRRSAHGNAYFTGLGRAKRIVFFDTLLSRLNGEEVEAVLAHELGHFRRRHIAKRMVATFLMSAAGLWLLAWLATRPWFYQGLGITPSADVEAIALVLFFLVIPVFAFPLQPLASLASRRHEFEADQFAAQHSRASDLVSALVKMYEDNASTLTPDPLHSAFYDSHPPAAIRVGRLSPA